MALVLFVNLEGKIAGAETSLLLLVKYLREQFAINVACSAPSRLSRALARLGVRCCGLPAPPRGSYLSLLSLPYLLKATYTIARLVLKTRPDLIHANSVAAGAVCILPVLIARRKLVLHARDLNGSRWAAKFCARFCEKIIAVSFAVKNSLVRAGVKAQKIEVVYNGVDSDYVAGAALDEAPLKERVRGPNHGFVFAQVGQFVPWKNHIVFLKAACRVAQQLAAARFLLAGDDIFGRDSAYKRRLLRYATGLPVAERIVFLGWQHNMQRLWPLIDCLVHPADREPFGRVIIEAMANSVPVIAVQSCGPREIITNGSTGMLVPANDVAQLAGAMLKIAGDADLARNLSVLGRQLAIKNFAAAATAQRVSEIYKELLIL